MKRKGETWVTGVKQVFRILGIYMKNLLKPEWSRQDCARREMEVYGTTEDELENAARNMDVGKVAGIVGLSLEWEVKLC